MPLSRKLIAGALATAVLALSAGAALADPGQATGSVNVRTGPGTSYPIVGTLYPGEDVDIGSCDGGWCYVRHDGPPGYVSGNYLTGAEYQPAPVYVPPPDIYVSPPFFGSRPFYHRPFGHPGFPQPGNHFPHPGSGNFPHPGMGNHPHPGMGNSPHMGGSNPGHGNFCATNPTVCQQHHQRP
jgi:hypothetical protein